MAIEVDILEDYIYDLSPELLITLLKDHTTSKEGEPQHIKTTGLVQSNF